MERPDSSCLKQIRSGMWLVMDKEAPERAESGAIAMISPKGRIISIKLLNPCASKPSSFEIRISGRINVFFY